MSGFNDFDELVILEVLAENYDSALFTSELFDLSEILLEEIPKTIFSN